MRFHIRLIFARQFATGINQSQPADIRSLYPCPQLTDRLALERTHLVNERTLLAYLRSSLTLVIAGFTRINFFWKNLCVWVGVVLVPVGVAVAVGGWFRFWS